MDHIEEVERNVEEVQRKNANALRLAQRVTPTIMPKKTKRGQSSPYRDADAQRISSCV